MRGDYDPTFDPPCTVNALTAALGQGGYAAPETKVTGFPTCAYFGNQIGAILPVMAMSDGQNGEAFFTVSAVDGTWVFSTIGNGRVCEGTGDPVAQALGCG